MGLTKLAMAALSVWGSLTWADLSDANRDLRQEVSEIEFRVARLNYYYPQLNVAVRADVAGAGAGARGQLFLDLEALEQYMQGKIWLPLRSLRSIACGAVCGGGGDDGKCHTCSIDDK